MHTTTAFWNCTHTKDFVFHLITWLNNVACLSFSPRYLWWWFHIDVGGATFYAVYHGSSWAATKMSSGFFCVPIITVIVYSIHIQYTQVLQGNLKYYYYCVITHYYTLLLSYYMKRCTVDYWSEFPLVYYSYCDTKNMLKTRWITLTSYSTKCCVHVAGIFHKKSYNIKNILYVLS